MVRNMMTPNLSYKIMFDILEILFNTPVVELDAKVNYRDANVDEGWHNGEDEVLQQVVDGGRPPVHHPQHLPRLPPQVPPEAQAVQVLEQPHLYLPGGELLHLDPKQGPCIVEETLPHPTSLEQFEHNPDSDLFPRPDRLART